MKSGNLPILERAARSGKIGRTAEAMFGSLLRYDLDGFMQKTKRCQSSLVKGRPSGWQVTAISCNELQRQTSIAEGDGQAFLSAANYAKQVLFPAASAMFHRSVGFDNGLDDVDLGELAHATPPVSERWTHPSAVVPLGRLGKSPASPGMPEVGIVIDGVHSDAVLGLSSGLLAPLTFIGNDAEVRSAYRLFGLKRLVAGFASAGSVTDLGKHRGADLALATKVVVGPLELDNLAVMLVRSADLPPGIYISMSLLRRFGGVDVERSQIHLSRSGGGGCGAAVEMSFATDGGVRGELIFPAHLNGRVGLASWKPLDGTGLQVESSFFKAATSTEASGFSANAGSHQPVIEVSVGGARLRTGAAHARADWSYPYQVMVGSAALRTHNVYLDFAGEQPTIQFCAIPGAATRAKTHDSDTE